MSASTDEIFVSLKRNGFEISLLEVEKILSKLVEEGFIQREMPSGTEETVPEGVTGFSKFNLSFKTKPFIVNKI